ncbi:hypothetical protein QBC45DRAFT_24808 [Copromyces sp. CBS 386.78]|nr:hypothetical protein QBC45DRAFT_24808 [Copromyces sp. CBS 386.78]
MVSIPSVSPSPPSIIFLLLLHYYYYLLSSRFFILSALLRSGLVCVWFLGLVWSAWFGFLLLLLALVWFGLLACLGAWVLRAFGVAVEREEELCVFRHRQRVKQRSVLLLLGIPPLLFLFIFIYIFCQLHYQNWVTSFVFITPSYAYLLYLPLHYATRATYLAALTSSTTTTLLLLLYFSTCRSGVLPS